MLVRMERLAAGALTAVMLSLVCAGGTGVEAKAERTVVRSAYENEEAPSPDVPACERVDDACFERAVLVGDSMADGLAIHGVMPTLQLLTRIGLSPRTALTQASFKNDDKSVTLDKKLPVMRPSAVYLWLGTNGLDTRDVDKVLDDYDRLLNRLLTALPDTPFYLLEVTPVTLLEHERYADFTNGHIDTFNAALRELAERHNVYVLPVNALLKDDDGLLVADYAAEDGIHLRKPAYELLAEYLYTHVLPAVEEAEEEAE